MVVSEEREAEVSAKITLRGIVIGVLAPAIATVVAYPSAPSRP